MKRDRLEVAIQRDIELALGAEPDLLLFRNSVGKATYTNAQTGATYHVPYGLGGPGSPDLVGFLAPRGVGFALEIKVPGEEAEPHQAKLHDVWRRFGVLVETVHSVAEARAALARARKAVAA